MSSSASKLPGDERLALCWGSLEGANLAQLVEAAAVAGFNGITVNTAMYEDALKAGQTPADIRTLLTVHDLQVSNVDPLFNWLPSSTPLAGEDIIARCTRASAAEVIRVAQELGTDLVNAPLGFAQPESEQQVIDCYGALCEQAAAQGLRVSLEFMPFTAVDSLATAARIVSAAECANGGIMFDCWHFHRSGGTPDDLLAVDGEKIIAVQLDDALPTPMSDMIEETLNHRLSPGEGCIDLAAIFCNLQRIGVQAIYDVEVFQEELRALEFKIKAQHFYAACAPLFDSTANSGA